MRARWSFRIAAIISTLLAVLWISACSDNAKSGGGASSSGTVSKTIDGVSYQLASIYEQDFSSGKLGPEWKIEGGDWRVENGTLQSNQAFNKDLLLVKNMPQNAVIEVSMISHSPQVDIKFRAWGHRDGNPHDNGAYHFILGGWNNSLSTLAPFGEHDKRRIVKRGKLKQDTWYKATVVRNKGVITLYLDGKPFMRYDDVDPLDAATFSYFSFGNWKSVCEFDNLKIYKIVN